MIHFILCSLLLSYSFSQCAIQTIYSIKEIETVLKQCDQNSLVAFDVDETILMPQDKALRKSYEKIADQIRDYYYQRFDDQKRSYFNSIILKSYQYQLVESEFPSVIKNLQQRNVRVIGFTHLRTGAYHAIENLEEWRFNQLINLGIDMRIGNPENYSFNFAKKKEGTHPIFYKGTLLTDWSCDKGTMLAAFLTTIAWKPSSIIFLDDRIDNVKAVDQAMKALDIPCLAFHYLAEETSNSDLDKELVHFQYRYLLDHKIWLNDEEGTIMMKGRIGNIENKLPCL